MGDKTETAWHDRVWLCACIVRATSNKYTATSAIPKKTTSGIEVIARNAARFLRCHDSTNHETAAAMMTTDGHNDDRVPAGVYCSNTRAHSVARRDYSYDERALESWPNAKHDSTTPHTHASRDRFTKAFTDSRRARAARGSDSDRLVDARRVCECSQHTTHSNAASGPARIIKRNFLRARRPSVKRPPPLTSALHSGGARERRRRRRRCDRTFYCAWLEF